MLRAATPLSVLLLIAFGFLLIAVLSPPIVPSFPLAKVNGVSYGVFGSCRGNLCTSIRVGPDVVTGTQSTQFEIPNSARAPLAKVLIIHPLAALVTGLLFFLAVISHIRSLTCSTKYLLFLFLVSLVDFLICLATFLVDYLLFSPHLYFASYFVLAAAVIVLLASVMTITMQRVLAGRRRRERTVANNAEMSGENYFTRETLKRIQTAQNRSTPPTRLDYATAPPASLKSGLTENVSLINQATKKDDQSSDERVPFNFTSPSGRSSDNGSTDPMTVVARSDAYGSNYNLPYQTYPARDQYGHPFSGPPQGYDSQRPGNRAPPGNFGWGGPIPAQYGDRGRGGYGPPRGFYQARAGAGPGPGLGLLNGGPISCGPPGAFNGPYGRGGIGLPPGRGGFGFLRGSGAPMMGMQSRSGNFRPEAPPQDFYNPAYDPGPVLANDLYDDGIPAPLNYQPYSSSRNPSMPSILAGSSEDQRDQDLPRAESPPPLDFLSSATADNIKSHSIMSPSDASELEALVPLQYSLRDSDADIAGLVNLQQARADFMTDPDRYSGDVASLANSHPNWDKASLVPFPLHLHNRSTTRMEDMTISRPSVGMAARSGYYEDVDPRFAFDSPILGPDTSSRPRSPATSVRSNYTSAAQRGSTAYWTQTPPTPVPSLPTFPDGQLTPQRGLTRSQWR